MGMVRQDIFKKISFLFAINYVDGNLKIFLMAICELPFFKTQTYFSSKKTNGQKMLK